MEALLMATAGPNGGGTFANDTTIGTSSWGTPSNASAEDGTSTTTAAIGNGTVANYLKCTNFGFSIPAGSTINGITVEVKAKRATTSRNLTIATIKLVKAGTIQGNNNGNATVLGTTLAYATFGSVSDLWGLAFGASDINDSTFGVAISCTGGAGKGSVTGSIDYVRITITYTAATGGPFPHFARRELCGGMIEMQGN
jgi:hypothetical protein